MRQIIGNGRRETWILLQTYSWRLTCAVLLRGEVSGLGKIGEVSIGVVGMISVREKYFQLAVINSRLLG